MTDADSDGNRLSCVDSNGNVRNRRVSPIASGRSDGPLSDHRAGGQPAQRELVFMPHTCRSRYSSGSVQLGGFLRFQICAAFDTHGLKAVI